ncbi:LysR family transcriptional regulator [Halomonas organivorans]|uniref:DNA-binding transcriptional LysR family regulator n=2 Tax=Halomonas organivorans TaxID=257772 RepID=A0A7W5G5B6_9GAMM|nr:DNA-binding transcriptional LysR family regulator [Halomonas organivorans]
MRIDMRHLHAYLAVAEMLHFRQAAERLNLAQPALSRTIRQLEDAIGEQLLERDNRNVTLTEPGRVFLEECRLLIGQLDTAVLKTQRAGLGEVGRLRIGYTDFAITGHLPELLEEFKARQPDIRFDLSFGSTQEQLEQLHDERIDFAFVTGPNVAADLVTTTIQRDGFIALVSDEHRLAARTAIDLQELADEPFIVGSIERWKHFRRHLDALCMSAGFLPRVAQETFNSEGIFGFVAANFGVTIHLECARNYIRKGVTPLAIRNAPQYLETQAAWCISPMTPVKRRFAEFIAANAV